MHLLVYVLSLSVSRHASVTNHACYMLVWVDYRLRQAAEWPDVLLAHVNKSTNAQVLRASLRIPVIVTSESKGMIFFWTSSRGPGLKASFWFRSSASRALFSLSWAAREEPCEAGSAQHTAGPQRQTHKGNLAANVSFNTTQNTWVRIIHITSYHTICRPHLCLVFLAVLYSVVELGSDFINKLSFAFVCNVKLTTENVSVHGACGGSHVIRSATCLTALLHGELWCDRVRCVSSTTRYLWKI